jgi:uncharacterized protein (UPF0248 family)
MSYMRYRPVKKMKTAKEMLDKLKWDKSENLESYTIYYYDRVLDKCIPIDFNQVTVEDGCIRFKDHNDKTITVPLHRLRKITKTVWERDL